MGLQISRLLSKFESIPDQTALKIRQNKKQKKLINPQASVAQKVADEVVFRRFQGEEVDFFLIGPH